MRVNVVVIVVAALSLFAFVHHENSRVLIAMYEAIGSSMVSCTSGLAVVDVTNRKAVCIDRNTIR